MKPPGAHWADSARSPGFLLRTALFKAADFDGSGRLDRGEWLQAWPCHRRFAWTVNGFKDIESEWYLKNLKYQTWTKIHLLHFPHVCFMFLLNVWGSFGSHEAALKSVDDIGWHKICWRNISKVGFQNTIFAMPKHAKTAINCSFKPARFVFFVYSFFLYTVGKLFGFQQKQTDKNWLKDLAKNNDAQHIPALYQLILIMNLLVYPGWICYW